MLKLNIRATLKELWSRKVDVSKNKKEENIYYNGENNQYPSEIERVINNSPIASRAANIMGKYISGAGVLGPDGIEIKREDLPIINKKYNLTIADIFGMGGRSIAFQNGIFFWRGISIDFEGENPVFKKGQLEVLDFKKCRPSIEDGDENQGKIWYRNWEIPEDKKKNPARWFYPFSDNHDVIMAQLQRDFKERYGKNAEFDIEKAIKCYRGQVLFLNMTPEFILPLSPFDSAYNDCDTDFRISLYNNTNTRDGFLGKVIIQTQGLDEEQQKKTVEDLQQWLGAENAGNLYLQNVEQTDNLDLALKVTQLKPTFDDKLFIETDSRNRRNILGCANNLPQQLVYASDGALFSAGSDTLEQYKIFYSEQTEGERSALVRAVKQLGFDYGIIPIGGIKTVQNDNPTA